MLKGLILKSSNAISSTSTTMIQDVITTTIKNSNGDMSIIDNYWPKIEELLFTQLLSVAENSLQDEKQLKQLFSTAYEFVPTPVRLLLPKEVFVQFCLKRKEPILEKLQEYKASQNISIKDQNNNIDNIKIKNNNSSYNELLPELLALCIVADGIVESDEIKLASNIIKNDIILNNKDEALISLSKHIGSMIVDKNASQHIYKSKSIEIFSKISKINNEDEKERIMTITEGMLEVSNKNFLSETKEVTDTIQNKLYQNCNN